jgi:integrase
VEHDTPKTLHQIRKIPISQAIRQRLDILLKRSSGALVVTSKTGTIFRPSTFLKDVWTKAAKASGITDKVPYSMRHSFAAWSLTLRIDPNRLVRLMGHGTKKMIYEVYGEGLKRIYGRFWSISAGTSWSRRERILPWSSITRKAIPCWFRPFLPSSPLKTEAPHSH